MSDKTITLRAELVDRLERLASTQRRSLDEVLSDVLEQYTPDAGSTWALAVAEGMEKLDDVDWLDEPDASERNRQRLKASGYRKKAR